MHLFSVLGVRINIIIIIVLIDFKGYFQGQKGPIWNVIYDLSVDLATFDFGLPLNVKSRSQTFKVVVSHKWGII